MAQDGICAGGYGGGTVSNCCSMGDLSVINGTSSKTVGAIIKGGSYDIHKNCYYLSGIQGMFTLSAKEGDKVFYKTSENEEDMTTEKVVEKLNEYIRLKGVLEEGDTEVDTAGWCRWKVGENNLPELELEWEWDPTAGENGTGAFVKVNN